MTIVFLSPRFYPQLGGVEKHAFEIARRITKKNKVIVVTESYQKDKREEINRIIVQRLYFGQNSWFKKFVIWWKILKYRKLIKKADIVHCHDVFFWYLPLRIIYPSKKVYVTFHGYETIYPPKTSAVFIRRLSEKLSNGNIAVGRYIEKWYGTKSNAVIYGAVDETESEKFKVKGSKLKVLFIGRIEDDTGIKIYSEVLKRLKNYYFEVCGDGSKKLEFEKFGKVYGFVQNLSHYIANADIIFASSYLSILAAMRLKKPVFSVFENPLKEDYLKLTPFSKWIYIANSSKILIQKIKTVIKNKKLREKNINQAYNWANEQTWDKIVRMYVELWKE